MLSPGCQDHQDGSGPMDQGPGSSFPLSGAASAMGERRAGSAMGKASSYYNVVRRVKRKPQKKPVKHRKDQEAEVDVAVSGDTETEHMPMVVRSRKVKKAGR